MSDTIKIEDIRRLADESDEAQRKAADSVRPVHDRALAEARRLRDRLHTGLSTEKKRDRLARIIEQVTEKRQPNRDVATTILAQYVQRLATVAKIPSSKLTDGTFLWSSLYRHLTDWTWGLSVEQQAKALDAFVLASQNEIDAGLAEFPRQWSGAVELPNLEALAKMANAKAVATYRSEIKTLSAQYAEAAQWAEALEQSTPRFFTTQVGEAVSVHVMNHRPGDVSTCDVRFTGGAVTEVSFDAFDRLQHDGAYNAMIRDGTLSLAGTGQLAQPA